MGLIPAPRQTAPRDGAPFYVPLAPLRRTAAAGAGAIGGAGAGAFMAL